MKSSTMTVAIIVALVGSILSVAAVDPSRFSIQGKQHNAAKALPSGALMEIKLQTTAAGSVRVNVTVAESVYLNHPEVGIMLKVGQMQPTCSVAIRPASGLEFRVVFSNLPTETSTLGKWRTGSRAGDGRYFVAAITSDAISEHLRRLGGQPGTSMVVSASSGVSITEGNGLGAAIVQVCLFDVATGEIKQSKSEPIVVTNGPYAHRYDLWTNIQSVGYPSSSQTQTVIGVVQTNIAVTGVLARSLLYLNNQPTITCIEHFTGAPIGCGMAQITVDSDGGVCNLVTRHRNGTNVCMQLWQITIQGVTLTTRAVSATIKFVANRVSDPMTHRSIPITIVAKFDIANSAPSPMSAKNDPTTTTITTTDALQFDPMLIIDVTSKQTTQRYLSNVHDSLNSGAILHNTEDDMACVSVRTRTPGNTNIMIHDAIILRCHDKSTLDCHRIELVNGGHVNDFIATNLDGNLTTSDGVSTLCFRSLSSMHGELIFVWHAEPYITRLLRPISKNTNSISRPWCSDGRTLCHGRVTISFTISCAGTRTISPTSGLCVGPW